MRAPKRRIRATRTLYELMGRRVLSEAIRLSHPLTRTEKAGLIVRSGTPPASGSSTSNERPAPGRSRKKTRLRRVTRTVCRSCRSKQCDFMSSLPFPLYTGSNVGDLQWRYNPSKGGLLTPSIVAINGTQLPVVVSGGAYEGNGESQSSRWRVRFEVTMGICGLQFTLARSRLRSLRVSLW